MDNKVILDEVGILQSVTAQEKLELSWDNKLLGFDSNIKSTDELAVNYKNKILPIGKEKVFKPSILDLIAVGCALLLLSILLVSALIKQKDLDGIAYVIIPIFLIILFIVFIKHYSDKEKNFKIIISTDGLIIKEDTYGWDEIYKTLIIIRPQQQETGKKYFLVLILQNGVTTKYDFTNLATWESIVYKLSAYIEQYRKLSILNSI